MIARREWYGRTEATWPAAVPALSEGEAERAAKKLYRFLRGKPLGVPVVITSGRRYNGMVLRGHDFQKFRALAVNPGRGWKALVHELSHSFGGSHSKEHARLEARMIREVLRRGWLAGALKSEAKPQPRKDEKARRALERCADALCRWQTKKKRAANAVKKLEKRYRLLSRQWSAACAEREAKPKPANCLSWPACNCIVRGNAQRDCATRLPT